MAINQVWSKLRYNMYFPEKQLESGDYVDVISTIIIIQDSKQICLYTVTQILSNLICKVWI